MSNVFSKGFRLHVYLSRDPQKTGGFQLLRQLAYESYDRDVVVDLEFVDVMREEGLLILLTLQEILLQAGHKLILNRPSYAVQQWLSGQKVYHLFCYE